jgi:hypothetical protein
MSFTYHVRNVLNFRLQGFQIVCDFRAFWVVPTARREEAPPRPRSDGPGRPN